MTLRATGRLDSSGTFVLAVPASTKVAMVSGWAGPWVVLDGAGSTYLGMGAFFPGPEQAVVGKYDASGNALWGWQTGGTGPSANTLQTGVAGILIDGAGTLTVVGPFTGTRQFGAQSFTASGDGDVFLAKLDSAGKLVTAEQLGGPGKDWASAVRDGSGNLYVVQQSIVLGGTTLASKGEMDIFVWKRPP